MDTSDAIHQAAALGERDVVRRYLDADPARLEARDRKGATPIHRAVSAGVHGVIELLLDRGADLHARHLDGPGDDEGYAPVDFEPLDLALFQGRADHETARLLLARGARRDLTIAAALGDRAFITAALDADPERIHEARPCGLRPLSVAVEAGDAAIAALLLERGADPTWPELDAPRGRALHAAARRGDAAMVERLLDHGADPNAAINSAGSPTYAARTPAIRARLLARGGVLDCYDLVWLHEDDEVVRRVTADPRAAEAGCGGVFTVAAALHKRELVVRLLAAGARVPRVVSGCHSYLLDDLEILQLLLAGGMPPDVPNPEGATLLHVLCGRDGRGRLRPHRTACASLLIEAGAAIDARDRETQSTPLAWAIRHDVSDMIAFLRARGATASSERIRLS